MDYDFRGSDLQQSTMKDSVQKSTDQHYPKTNRSSSYLSQDPVLRRLRRRRNIRKLRHEIITNSYTLISIRRLRPQITNDPLTNQLFNGSSFF
ncbi:hypothetical protein RclHR1_05980007 [Rhizophagus clarus]|uniref:Uncharacterized protein n=1 Tax=Rhizophagus clarus TaxID=94130 RepID=A0A2Z6SHG9_9GLOM|nr:hypothetical protein RclHR1_05980007 [Rhizophagus clarus]GES85690.1 hypothetical protein GLOIN_2v1869068 [Rhizophagus clarus]